MDKQYLKVRTRSAYLPQERFENWNRETVTKAILELNSASPLTTLRSMRVSREPVPDPILSKFVGHPCSRKFLHQAGIQYFGSWNSALRASGLEPIKAPYNKFWNKTLIVDSIKALRKSDHPLTVQDMWMDRSRET
ncbi:MAG: hypothetical protein ABL958_16155, partial [Bdellovibrionia bacterium]